MAITVSNTDLGAIRSYRTCTNTITIPFGSESDAATGSLVRLFDAFNASRGVEYSECAREGMRAKFDIATTRNFSRSGGKVVATFSMPFICDWERDMAKALTTTFGDDVDAHIGVRSFMFDSGYAVNKHSQMQVTISPQADRA